MSAEIAINTKHYGDRSKDSRGYAEPMNREQVDSLLSEKWIRDMVADIRGGNNKAKDWLPFACPHYARFRNNHRAQADIIPEAFTYITCVDVDDKSKVEEAISKTKALIADDMSDWQELILRMDYSARKKLHIWLRLPVGKTIAETQSEFCKEIGIPYDESCITPERFIYLTGIDEEIYRSEHWLEPLSEQELEERREAFLMRGLDVDGREFPSTEIQNPSPDLPRGGGEDAPKSQPCCTEKARYIFKACMRECELEPEVLVVEGARHEAVKSILSVGATQLLTKDEFLGALSEMMPQNWQDKNIQTLVDDFYSKYHDPSQKMTQFQRRVLARSLKLNKPEEPVGLLGNPSSVPPEMPEKKPKLIQLLISKTPKVYQPAVAHAVFPPLATHLKEVRFCYTDNVEHEATLMNCLMAGTGAGKGCIDKPIERIMADIERRDKENERREAEWKKDCQKKGANKDKLLRPEGLVIQIIDPDMTKPALVTRMDEAEGHFVYVKLNELDLFEQLKGATGKQHFQLMCLAFDSDATYGQTRIGTQSVTARPMCRFNWNACTTILKGRRFFRNVLTDGPISRINFCTIPEQEIGAKQPVYGQYDSEFDEALKPYIDNLVAARGLIVCPQAYKLITKLQEECAEFAQLSQNDTYWNLSHRACVIAWLKACVLYVANGQKWEKSIDDFIRWSLNYDLWCKMQFFGNKIEEANKTEESRIGVRGPKPLLMYLPDEFTTEDAIRVRQKEGLSADNTRKMISQWKTRGYILQLTVDSFKKSEKYKLKNL
jgi:hypothetical protein